MDALSGRQITDSREPPGDESAGARSRGPSAAVRLRTTRPGPRRTPTASMDRGSAARRATTVRATGWPGPPLQTSTSWEVITAASRRGAAPRRETELDDRPLVRDSRLRGSAAEGSVRLAPARRCAGYSPRTSRSKSASRKPTGLTSVINGDERSATFVRGHVFLLGTLTSLWFGHQVRCLDVLEATQE